MNKFKFFGSAIMAAFFAFSLASCEKEDFNTDVDIDVPEVEIPNAPEGYKPGDAVLTIQPTVIAVIDGEIKNVTNEAKITYNGSEKLEYSLTPDKGIAAMEIEIEASYDVELNGETQTLTVKSTLSTPALSAGQVAIFTPTLVVSANSEPEGEDPEDPEQPGGEDPEDPEQPGGEDPENPEQPGGEDPEDPEQPEDTDPSFIYDLNTISTETNEKVAHFHYLNNNPYCVTKTLIANLVKGSISGHESFSGLAKVQELISRCGTYTQDFGTADLWPNSITCVKATQTMTKETISVTRTMSKANGEAVGTIIFEYQSGIVWSYDFGLAIENGDHGHSHGYTGHGHGHGHGNSNAGGGIAIPM